MKKPKGIVLDSWAVMAYLEDEPAAERVADLIADAHDDGGPLFLSVVNAGEIWYIVARRASAPEADRVMKLLLDIGVRVVDADWPLTRIAAGFKTKGKLSYADAFAAALAKQTGATLLTGDPEFRRLAHDIDITWLRP